MDSLTSMTNTIQQCPPFVIDENTSTITLPVFKLLLCTSSFDINGKWDVLLVTPCLYYLFLLPLCFEGLNKHCCGLVHLYIQHNQMDISTMASTCVKTILNWIVQLGCCKNVPTTSIMNPQNGVSSELALSFFARISAALFLFERMVLAELDIFFAISGLIHILRGSGDFLFSSLRLHHL